MKTLVRRMLLPAVCSLALLGATGVIAQATGPAPNTARLRALDWVPFETALQGFPAEKAAGIDALLARASIPDVQAAIKGAALSAEDLTL